MQSLTKPRYVRLTITSLGVLGGRPGQGAQPDCVIDLSICEETAPMIAIPFGIEAALAEAVDFPRLAEKAASAAVLGSAPFVVRHYARPNQAWFTVAGFRWTGQNAAEGAVPLDAGFE